MNKVISFIVIITIFTVYSCYKPSVPLDCAWSDATLGGKSYKISKITFFGIDSTSAWLAAYPCLNNTIIANTNGTYKMTNAAGCTSTDTVGTWKTYSNGGKHYLISNADTGLINKFDCNSYTKEDTIGLLPVLYTYTKQ